MAWYGNFLSKFMFCTLFFTTGKVASAEYFLPPITPRAVALTALYGGLVMIVNATFEGSCRQVAFGLLISIPVGMLSQYFSKSMDLEEAFGKALIVILGWIFAFGMLVQGKLDGHVPLVVLIGHLAGSALLTFRKDSCTDRLGMALKKIVPAQLSADDDSDCLICAQTISEPVLACINKVVHPICSHCVAQWIGCQLEQGRYFSIAQERQDYLRCSHCTLPFQTEVVVATLIIGLGGSVDNAFLGTKNNHLLELISREIESGHRSKEALERIVKQHIPILRPSRRSLTREEVSREIISLLERII